MFQGFTILSYANSAINPVLYAFTNENFREAFINAFKCAADPILGVAPRRASEYVSVTNNSHRHKTTAGGDGGDKEKNGGCGGQSGTELTCLTSSSTPLKSELNDEE